MYAAEVAAMVWVVLLLRGELHDLMYVGVLCVTFCSVDIFWLCDLRRFGKCACFDPSVAAATTRACFLVRVQPHFLSDKLHL